MSAPYTSPLAAALAEDLLERFQRYVRLDTQSSLDSGSLPSTPGQLELARLLEGELRDLGMDDARVTENGCVLATLPGSAACAGPVIALLAHLDTSPDAPGHGVEPLVHRDYRGGVLELPRGSTTLDPQRMPELGGCVGHDLVTSSGDTLLGADDKAGVAEIMAAVAHLAGHPELPRATLRVCFLPDEEIGVRGAQVVDLDELGATCGYTLDGSVPGELQDESFAAEEAQIEIRGVEVHPGHAHGKLVSALRLAAGVVAALPGELTPEATSGREGFLHVLSLEATAGEARMRVLIRDFDAAALKSHRELLRRTAEEVVGREPRAQLSFTVESQYRNMRRFLEGEPRIVGAAEEAMRREGIEPVRHPIRGGTDGSILSERGLPTPNLFAGYHEIHSVREWASLQEMAAAAATIVRLAGVWAESGVPGEGLDDGPAG